MSIGTRDTAASLENSLECVLCTSKLHDPLLLSCLHNVCHLCASKACNSVTCPICLVTTDCTSMSANLVVSALLHHFAALERPGCCGPSCCEERNPGITPTSWCHACQRSLCFACDNELESLNISHEQGRINERVHSPELHRAPTRLCKQHSKELSMACFTCHTVLCSLCALSCTEASHDAVSLGDRAFSERLQTCKSKINDLLSHLNESSMQLELHTALLESVANARRRDVKALVDAKQRALEALSRTYLNAETSLLQCYDTLEANAIVQCEAAIRFKKRILESNQYCNMVLKSDDHVGLFSQVHTLSMSIQSLHDQVAQMKGPIEPSKLVLNKACLPQEVDSIMSHWFGVPSLLCDNLCCVENELSALGYCNSTKVTIQLPIACCDVSMTEDGRLLLAASVDGLLEHSTSCGHELSRWRPPRWGGGNEDLVQAVEALSDDRAAVGVWYTRLVLVLRRVVEATGDDAWTVERRLYQLQHEPPQLQPLDPCCLSSRGDVLAVAERRSSGQLELASVCDEQQPSSSCGELEYRIKSVAITDDLIITVSYQYMTGIVSDGRRAQVVDAHSRSDNQKLVWRHVLSPEEEAEDVCSDAEGVVLYVAVTRSDKSAGRVMAISTEDGGELHRDVVSCGQAALPYRLCTRKAQQRTSLVVLGCDAATKQCRTVTIIPGINR